MRRGEHYDTSVLHIPRNTARQVSLPCAVLLENGGSSNNFPVEPGSNSGFHGYGPFVNASVGVAYTDLNLRWQESYLLLPEPTPIPHVSLWSSTRALSTLSRYHCTCINSEFTVPQVLLQISLLRFRILPYHKARILFADSFLHHQLPARIHFASLPNATVTPSSCSFTPLVDPDGGRDSYIPSG